MRALPPSRLPIPTDKQETLRSEQVKADSLDRHTVLEILKSDFARADFSNLAKLIGLKREKN